MSPAPPQWPGVGPPTGVSAVWDCLKARGTAAGGWDFTRSSDPRIARESLGGGICLRSRDGEVAHVSEGVETPVAVFRGGAHLYAPREALGPFNIFGEDAQVTMLAWFRRDSTDLWQAIGGVWDESRAKRQYGMFVNARVRSQVGADRLPCRDLCHAHLSFTGDKDPGKNACWTYATNPLKAECGRWVFLAGVYDGRSIRVFVDGRFVSWEGSNPYPLSGGIFDGGADGAELTIGANSVAGRIGNHFDGAMAGYMVCREALPDECIAGLAGLASGNRRT